MNSTAANDFPSSYSRSRLGALRRVSRVVRIGAVKIGGQEPIAVQSMTNTTTTDVAATVAQAIALAEAGCQIVRVTAPNIAAARALKDIRAQFSAAGFEKVPLVADIHFLPAAAMEAALHVEKVRINPGNYADRKLKEARDYTPEEYATELERLHEAVTPLVLRCKELGRAIRVGVNHGSLSDRIMNRYGDTPAGMCESALEFLRICEAHDFHDIVVSLKASNPKVMIQASRLIAARMDAEGLNYPLHLGVTEAGGGEDARVKSALGIGTILRDGLGDTIRVSLTENPVEEVPVALALAREAENLWKEAEAHADEIAVLPSPSSNPFAYLRRPCEELALGPTRIGAMELPRVAMALPGTCSRASGRLEDYDKWAAKNPKMKAELALLPANVAEDLDPVAEDASMFQKQNIGTLLSLPVMDIAACAALSPHQIERLGGNIDGICIRPLGDEARLQNGLAHACALGVSLVIDATPSELKCLLPAIKENTPARLVFTCTRPEAPLHPAGLYRCIAQMLKEAGIASPIWIRHTPELFQSVRGNKPADDTAIMMDAAVLIGGLLCEGIGDLVSVESTPSFKRALEIAYCILQGSRTRSTRTEYVACPSCGRTLFDLESTTARVRAATGHLEGVTIAVMGCIVNGPGEMADADFGYVGGAPGKINLYVGKKPVQIGIDSTNAVEHLVALIKEHGRWQEP